MNETVKRSTIYFEPQLYAALCLKSVYSHRSVSELVNDAVRNALDEDQGDLAAFEDRTAEPLLTYEEFLKDLKIRLG